MINFIRQLYIKYGKLLKKKCREKDLIYIFLLLKYVLQCHKTMSHEYSEDKYTYEKNVTRRHLRAVDGMNSYF